ncbi:MAG: LysM-like peptidoglycan-binding domain-containing protein, partial [Gammaproteobacteria bacterium]|nr:LysM-like peptidoglycan-binding domain-containing protein [Gammaproteobacteria bacterium]
MKKSFPKLHLIIVSTIAVIMAFLLMLSDDEPAPTDDPILIEVPLELTNKTDKPQQAPATPEATPPASEEPIIEEAWQTVMVKSGDNLTTLFRRVGLTPQDVYRIGKATKNSKSLTKLMPGQRLDFVINQGRVE